MAAHDLTADVLDARVARNRRAIYTGLKPFLPEDELMAALALWQARHAHGPAYALHGFLNEICTSAALKALRNDMHRSLRQALFGPDEALEPDPLLQIERWNSKGRTGTAGAKETPQSPETTVFETLFERFLQLIDEVQPVSLHIRSHIDVHLGRIVANGPLSVRVSRWLLGKQPRLDDGVKTLELRALLHLAYVLACEYVGPTAADSRLAEAVRQCEALEAARQCPPREFL